MKTYVITGYIENLDALLDRMRVSVAPLRFGAGIKGKIVSAMSVGLPVVATSMATEGMSLTDGENVLVADAANEFASSIARVYEDESVWNTLSRNGIAFANKAWGPEAAWRNLSEILARLGFVSQRNDRPLRLYSSVSDFSPKSPEARACLSEPRLRRSRLAASSNGGCRTRRSQRFAVSRIAWRRAPTTISFRSMGSAFHAMDAWRCRSSCDPAVHGPDIGTRIGGRP